MSENLKVVEISRAFYEPVSMLDGRMEQEAALRELLRAYFRHVMGDTKQTKFADALQTVGRGTVNQILSGVDEVTVAHLAALARYQGINVVSLLMAVAQYGVDHPEAFSPPARAVPAPGAVTGRSVVRPELAESMTRRRKRS